METEIERLLEEAKDGDLVELILKENNLPRVKENYSTNDHDNQSPPRSCWYGTTVFETQC